MNADGTYNLDCKPMVSRDRLRAPPGTPGVGGSSPDGKRGSGAAAFPAAQKSGELTGASTAAGAGTGTLGSVGGKFVVGQTVEYLSGTLNQWISARILSVNNDGTYNLDCKPLVAADRIRAVEGKPAVRFAIVQ